jgi:hypothetical protein
MRMHEFEQTDRRSQWPSSAGAEDVMRVLRAAKPARRAASDAHGSRPDDYV